MKKRRIIPWVLVACLVCCGCHPQPGTATDDPSDLVYSTAVYNRENSDRTKLEYASDDDRLAHMELMADNGLLQLYVDKNTAEFGIKKVATGQIWLSNPSQLSLDKFADPEMKKRMASQLSLTFTDRSQAVKEMNSWNDSVAKGQYEIKPLTNGVRIEFRIGAEEKARLIPEAIRIDVFEHTIYGKLDSERAQKRLLLYYKKLTLEGVSEQNRSALIKKYPLLEEQDIYVLKSVNEREKEEIEGYIQSTGYTIEQMQEEYDAIGYEVKITIDPALFKVSVEYLLDGNQFVARLPAADIQYNERYYSLSSVQFLEFFGCTQENKNGYIFIPDGSGALVDLTQPRSVQQILSNAVYATDYAINKAQNATNTQGYYLPVFGMKSHENAWLAMIEDGEALARISASLSAFTNSYNTVSAAFTLKSSDILSLENMGSDAGWTVEQKDRYKEDIQIRYAFMQGEQANYTGMAAVYRQRLVEQGVLTKQPEGVQSPLYVDVLGSVAQADSVLDQMLGKKAVLTSFEQTRKMGEQLRQAGVTGLQMRLQGWANGGLSCTAASKLTVERVLGGEKGLKDLMNFAAEQGIGVYPNVELLYANQLRIGDGFNAEQDASRGLDKKIARKVTVDLATNKNNTQHYRVCVRPGLYKPFAQTAFAAVGKYTKQLSLGSVGTDVNSDFHNKRNVNRQQAATLLRQAMAQGQEQGISMMLDGGNAYTYAYASHLVNVPLSGSGYIFAQQSIPFMQLVLHGYIPYAGTAMNYEADEQTAFLKCIEYGANLHYTLAYQNTESLKDTPYANHYSALYSVWKEKLVTNYVELNKWNSQIQNQTMLRHTQVYHEVYRTDYEGGLSVLVNYSHQDVQIDNVIIPARSYKSI